MSSTLVMPPATYYAHSRPEMLDFFPLRPGRVLDVGCSSGRFGATLKDKFEGVEVWGVEPAESACAQARLVLDRVVHGMFDDYLGLPDGYFDTIVFNDSLEHFPYTKPPLELARRLLRPGGRIVASIPNVRYWPHVKHFLFAADWHYADEGILDRTHLRFFTRKSILRTFRDAGFRVERIQGITPCWRDVRLTLCEALLPSGMRDMLYLQYALVAAPTSDASVLPTDPHSSVA